MSVLRWIGVVLLVIGAGFFWMFSMCLNLLQFSKHIGLGDYTHWRCAII